MKLKAYTSIAALSLAAISLPMQGIAADDDIHSQHAQTQKHSSVEKLKPLEGKAFESAFLKEMIHHHQMGIQMSELAQKQASRPELKQMVQKSISEQKNEVKQMTQWLEQWHGEKPAKMSMQDPSMQKSMKHMEQLKEAKGEDFDKLFLTFMPEHHAEGVQMAKLAQERAEHKEVQQLAGKIAQEQHADIQKMESWRATGR